MFSIFGKILFCFAITHFHGVQSLAVARNMSVQEMEGEDSHLQNLQNRKKTNTHTHTKTPHPHTRTYTLTLTKQKRTDRNTHSQTHIHVYTETHVHTSYSQAHLV